MKFSISTSIFCLISFLGYSQIDTINQQLLPMKSTITKPYKVGRIYYENGETTPFSGVLYGKYPNGNFLTKQEYKNGIGNGIWINYYEDGTIKEVGNYTDNRVEGPIVQYHPNGKIKAKGTYKHWKKKVGIWTYYDKNGILITTEDYKR